MNASLAFRAFQSVQYVGFTNASTSHQDRDAHANSFYDFFWAPPRWPSFLNRLNIRWFGKTANSVADRPGCQQRDGRIHGKQINRPRTRGEHKKNQDRNPPCVKKTAGPILAISLYSPYQRPDQNQVPGASVWPTRPVCRKTCFQWKKSHGRKIYQGSSCDL